MVTPACRGERQNVRLNGENHVVAVKHNELLEAFDFVSFAAPMKHQAYIDRTTGKIYWVSEAVDDELPEDLDESDRYIAIPHKKSARCRYLRSALASHRKRFARRSASRKRPHVQQPVREGHPETRAQGPATDGTSIIARQL